MPTVRVHVGTDHAGFEFKEHLVSVLRSDGYDVVDHGAATYDPNDDYPAFCFAAAEAVIAEPGSLAVVIGGSGNGEQIAANKVPGIRAALAWNIQTAQLARRHNNAQVVSIGGRFTDVETAKSIVDTFLATPFSEGERHVRRLDMVAAFERDGTLPPE